MRKSMYSLMLSEQVVEAIDRLALEQNTNRSRLINEILADYLSLVTPEKHIADVFRSIESFFDRTELIAAHAMNDNTLSLKSSLVYRYRPTIRYEVELFRTPERNIGQLKVNFRTQSPDLIVGLTEFFRLWARLENTYVLKLFPENALNYTLDETRFTRSLSVPVNARYDADDCANAISSYIKVFDAMLKKHLSGAYSDLTAMENDYLAYLNSGALII